MLGESHAIRRECGVGGRGSILLRPGYDPFGPVCITRHRVLLSMEIFVAAARVAIAQSAASARRVAEQPHSCANTGPAAAPTIAQSGCGEKRGHSRSCRRGGP